jgi:hypothetical protein
MNTQILNSPTPSQEIVVQLTPASSPEPNSKNTTYQDADQLLQGANFGYINNLDFNEFAVGMYDVNYPDCGNPIISDDLDQTDEILLELQYTSPVIPQLISIYTNINPSQIVRIELLNSISGLGVMLDENNSSLQLTDSPGGSCSTRFDISVQSELEIDTIFIEFDQASAVSQIASVEMLGTLANIWDPPVYWRVPLPGTPIDIAMGQNGMVYVAVEPNRLFAYDVEGNQLREYAVPEHSEIAAIASDSFGNLLIQDNGYDWFIMLSAAGEQLSTGVVKDFYWAEVNPINGNLYLMNKDEISSYTTDTGALVDQFMLDDMRDYSTLAFNPQGQMFVLGDAQWEPKIIEVNPQTFEEINATPLRLCNQMELTARDLTVDANGNQYVLFQVNCARIAVHQYDPNGILIKRFGNLTGSIDEWNEGAFLDPKAITVSSDGRFLLIADGYAESSFLTAYLMEID